MTKRPSLMVCGRGIGPKLSWFFQICCSSFPKKDYYDLFFHFCLGEFYFLLILKPPAAYCRPTWDMTASLGLYFIFWLMGWTPPSILDNSGQIWSRPHCSPSLEIMVNRGNHPQMALLQVSELLSFTQIIGTERQTALRPNCGRSGLVYDPRTMV